MNADSIKARLKNFAVNSNITFQEALIYYGIERTIYRISVSEYAEHFVLKGGIFLYAIFDRNYERATTDIDLLARKISNSSEEMKAEKLEAIIHNGYLNSRYKDFYDIYVLSGKYGFDYYELRNAVVETFENRKTTMTMDSAVFGEGFLNDPIHLTRWNAFLKKKKTVIQVSLPDAMAQIKNFVRPLIEGGNAKKWNPDDCWWE